MDANLASLSGYEFDTFRLDLNRLSVQEHGSDIELRPKAFEVLRRLVENSGRVLSKDELVAAVWPGIFVNDDALAQCVRDIRKALRDDGQRYIRTIPRRGYMFVAEVKPLDAYDMPGVQNKIPWSQSRRAWLGIVVMVAALAGLAGWFSLGRDAPPLHGNLTIAVLPFATTGATPDDDWLGEGIADDILVALARFRDLRVIARNSSFRFADTSVPADQIRTELGADFMLTGRVQRSGERIVATVQLLDTRTAAVRWAERYDRPISELLELNHDLAREIATQLVAEARVATIDRVRDMPLASLEAYELVVRGRRTYLEFTRDSALESEALARRALELDPSYAPAWELLSRALLQYYIQPYGLGQGEAEALAAARIAAQRAVDLDPGFALAHASLGSALRWAGNREEGLDALRRAVELNPSDASAHNMYADVLGLTGHHRESVDAFTTAAALDPFTPSLALAIRARGHIMLGEFDDALTLTRRCAERSPNLQACFFLRAIAAAESGHGAEAEAAVARVLEINPNFTASAHARLVGLLPQDEEKLVALMGRAGLPQ